MKRSKKKAVSKKNNNSRSLIIVAIIILVVGAFIYAGGLSTTGRVIDMNGEEIHEQNALTKKQLDEGVTLTGTNNYIRWTNDLDYNVPVDDVFGNSEVVYVWRVAALSGEGVKRWYGEGYSDLDSAILAKNDWYVGKGQDLRVLEPGVRYGIYVRNAPVMFSYSF